MFKRYFILMAVISCPVVLWAQYKLTSNNKVYYKTDESSEEKVLHTNELLPSGEVLIRMHSSSSPGETFTIKDIEENKEYVCKAPTTWPGKKLTECILMPVQRNAQKDTRRTAIARGDSESRHAPHFHYLCALVSDFDNANQWSSFHYSINDIYAMQNAFYSVCSQDKYLNGKQYLLSNPHTTKQDIVNHLDSIIQVAGKEDMVILYLSSHGAKDYNKQFHFIAKDSKQLTNGHFINTLSQSEINGYVNQLTAKNAKVLFFLDACYAGAILDKDIQGEAAYYLSTNESNPAYHNQFLGSPFAIALMQAMTGTLNKDYMDCFQGGKVQVGSLGEYISRSVAKSQDQEQYTMNTPHELSPAYILWRIHDSQNNNKNTARIIDLEEQANNEQLSPDKRAKYYLKLGDCFYKGSDTSIDFQKALRYYRDAASLSRDKAIKSQALLKISDCLYYGNPYKDPIASYEYALEAANLGNINAVYAVGWHLCEGEGVDKNIKEGIHWLVKAANQNHSNALRYLGDMYYNGEDVAKDYKKAAKYYTKAAEQGDAYAQLGLGCYYALS